MKVNFIALMPSTRISDTTRNCHPRRKTMKLVTAGSFQRRTNEAARISGPGLHLVVMAPFRSVTNQNRHRRSVMALAVLALAALLLLLGVFLSHERDQSVPKSVIMHGK
jgi:hypothetical protein